MPEVVQGKPSVLQRRILIRSVGNASNFVNEVEIVFQYTLIGDHTIDDNFGIIPRGRVLPGL